jgi:hypothetical protein
VVEVHKSIGWPEAGSQFLAGHELAGTLQEESQDLKGLVLKLYLGAISTEFPQPQVGLKDTEVDDSFRSRACECLFHDSPRLSISIRLD